MAQISSTRRITRLNFTMPLTKPYSMKSGGQNDKIAEGRTRPEHAVISTFDLFSVGVGPSSSHTVGPMRAARIFITDLKNLGLLERVTTVKIAL